MAARMQSAYTIHVRVIQTQPSAWFEIVEQTVYHNARGGAWTECADDTIGDRTLTMGGSGTSGILRFKNPKGEQFAVALGVHNYKRWCDIVPDVPVDQTAVAIHPTYYPSTIDTHKRGHLLQRVLEDRVTLTFLRILEDRRNPNTVAPAGSATQLGHVATSMCGRLWSLAISMAFIAFFLAYLAFLLVSTFILGHTDDTPKSKTAVFGQGIGNRGEMLWKQLPHLERTTAAGQKLTVDYYKEVGNVFYVSITIGPSTTPRTSEISGATS